MKNFLLSFSGIAVFILILYVGFSYIIQERIESRTNPYGKLLSYTEELVSDQYSLIPRMSLPGCSFCVYGSGGNQIYASDEKMTDLSYEDTQFLWDFEEDTYYAVYRNDLKATGGYYVVKEQFDEEKSESVIRGYCLIDDQYKIVEGDLFGGRKQLTRQQFNLLQGIYTDKRNVWKYPYKNVYGDDRVLIFISPIQSEKEYDRIVREANQLWMVAGIIAVAGILLISFLLDQKIKRGLRAELKEATLQRNKMEEQRQRAVADLTHDLKTPLTVITGYARALMDKMAAPEKQDEYIEAIYRKSEYTARLLDNLFEYTKLDHPDFSVHMKSTDYCEFCREYLGEKYTELEFKQLILNIEIPEKPLMVQLDDALFRRVLENIIDNVIKYNDPGAQIWFEVDRLWEKGEVQTIISDNGKGIPADLADIIFEPFVIADTARSSGKGTGLGMAVVKKIVELHGGKIELLAPKEKKTGTRIKMTIPLVEK